MNLFIKVEKEADVREQDYTRDSKGYFMYFFSVRKNTKHNVDLAVNLKSHSYDDALIFIRTGLF